MTARDSVTYLLQPIKWQVRDHDIDRSCEHWSDGARYQSQCAETWF